MHLLKQNSPKAHLCVRGKHLLCEYYLNRGNPHKKIGKWIIAQNETQVQNLINCTRRVKVMGWMTDSFFCSMPNLMVSQA